MRMRAMLGGLLGVLLGVNSLAATYMGTVGKDFLQLDMGVVSTANPTRVTLSINNQKAQPISLFVDKEGIYHFLNKAQAIHFTAESMMSDRLTVLSYQGVKRFAELYKFDQVLGKQRYSEVSCELGKPEVEASQSYKIFLANKRPFAVSFSRNIGKPSYNSCDFVAKGRVRRVGKARTIAASFERYDNKTKRYQTVQTNAKVISTKKGYNVTLGKALALSQAVCGHNVFLPAKIVFTKQDKAGYQCKVMS